MGKSGTYGDDIAVKVLSEIVWATILVYYDNSENCVIVEPDCNRSLRGYHILHLQALTSAPHYEALDPLPCNFPEPPTLKLPRMRKKDQHERPEPLDQTEFGRKGQKNPTSHDKYRLTTEEMQQMKQYLQVGDELGHSILEDAKLGIKRKDKEEVAKVCASKTKKTPKQPAEKNDSPCKTNNDTIHTTRIPGVTKKPTKSNTTNKTTTKPSSPPNVTKRGRQSRKPPQFSFVDEQRRQDNMKAQAKAKAK